MRMSSVMIMFRIWRKRKKTPGQRDIRKCVYLGGNRLPPPFLSFSFDPFLLPYVLLCMSSECARKIITGGRGTCSLTDLASLARVAVYQQDNDIEVDTAAQQAVEEPREMV